MGGYRVDMLPSISQRMVMVVLGYPKAGEGDGTGLVKLCWTVEDLRHEALVPAEPQCGQGQFDSKL